MISLFNYHMSGLIHNFWQNNFGEFLFSVLMICQVFQIKNDFTIIFCLSPTRRQHDMTLLLSVHDRPLYPMIPTYDRYCIYILCVYIYICTQCMYVYEPRNVFFYTTQLTGCSYLVLQSSHVFWGLTLLSNSAHIFNS